jgi:hypothetical protein
MLCECSQLTRTADLWMDHHPNCPKYDPVGELKALLAELVTGLEQLSADTDGIPDYLWEPYRRAAWVGGRAIPDQSAP